MIPQGYMHAGNSTSEVTGIDSAPMSQSQPPVSTVPESTIRPQFYQMASTPTVSSASIQFINNNPRPTKSARHSTSSDFSTLPLYHNLDERAQPTYTALTPADDPGQPSRGYFPVTSGPEAWSTGENSNLLYSTSTFPPSQSHFTFTSQPLLKDEALPGHYTWSAA